MTDFQPLRGALEQQARSHPAFADAIRNAIERAAKGEEISVWFDGTAIFVRPVEDKKPEGADSVCFVQRFNEKLVQLRYDGRVDWIAA